MAQMSTVLQQNASALQIAVASTDTGPNGREFGRTILAALDRGRTRVVIDCAAWGQLDISLLSALVRCADVFRRQGGELELVNVPSKIIASIRELRLHHRLGLVS
jgi:anti-anti-sigma regulatory factor